MPGTRQSRYKTGLRAEIIAAVLLFLKGYKVVAWRYKARGGEIDLVAVRRDVLAIVEVKARTAHEAALLAVNAGNRRRVEAAARHFIRCHPRYKDYVIRYDIVTVCGWIKLCHLDNAWSAGA